MEETRFSLELHETTPASRILKISLGIACLAASGWLGFSMIKAGGQGLTSWIAVIFLIFFGLWELSSGIGFTDRYLIIGKNKITLRNKFYLPSHVFTPSDLAKVEFETLTIRFFSTRGSSVTLHLGMYYQERSAKIMEEVARFCENNKITSAHSGSNSG